VLRPDDTDDNADWIKTLSWDIHPPTADRLLEALWVERAPLAEQQQAVAKFLTLPAAKAMPPELLSELRDAGLAPVPAGWVLSHDWWESVTWRGPRTLYDLTVALSCPGAPGVIQAGCAEAFYAEHPSYKAYIPPAIRREMRSLGWQI
jgi:hypothetical protein